MLGPRGVMDNASASEAEYSGSIPDGGIFCIYNYLNDSPYSQYEDRRFYFWADSFRQTFYMMPAMYSAPNLTMGQINEEHDSL